MNTVASWSAAAAKPHFVPRDPLPTIRIVQHARGAVDRHKVAVVRSKTAEMCSAAAAFATQGASNVAAAIFRERVSIYLHRIERVPIRSVS